MVSCRNPSLHTNTQHIFHCKFLTYHLHLAATCDELEPPPFGIYDCTDSNLIGSVCTFRCESGYQVIGETERICRNNSLWSSEEGSCRGKCYCPVIGTMLATWCFVSMLMTVYKLKAISFLLWRKPESVFALWCWWVCFANRNRNESNDHLRIFVIKTYLVLAIFNWMWFFLLLICNYFNQR